MNHYLRYLFLLSGFGIFISGVYFWGVCPFINALFPSIEFWTPPQAVLLVTAGGDIVTGLAIFTFGLLTIREPFQRAYLKWITALALLAVVFDLLGGLCSQRPTGLIRIVTLTPKGLTAIGCPHSTPQKGLCPSSL